jgi:rhodanese-related sulfurtransferase
MGQLPSRLGELDRNRPVYVVCASGNRSAAMTDVLVANGFDAYSVAGGTGAWSRSGRPVETGAARI